MKKIILFCFLFTTLCTLIHAQKKPGDAEIQKMLKGNKALQDEMKKNPELAKAMEKAMEGEVEEDEEKPMGTKPPKKQVAKIASIPAQVLSKNQLVQWSLKSYQSLYNKLSATEKAAYNAALSKCGNNATALEDAAFLNWLEKAPTTALLFAMKATQLNADEPMFWNNLAALLNMTDNHEKAIPSLLYLLKYYPANALVFNNLGQSYLGLGDMTKAMVFFDSCLKRDPDHPEANHSMGLIYRFTGNISKSNYHFEKETRVCIKKPVIEAIKKTKTEEEVYKIVKARWLKPENYFHKLGLDNFKVPKLPISVEESLKLWQPHQEFRKNVADEIQKWGELDADLVKKNMRGPVKTGIYSYALENVLLPHLEKKKEKTILAWLNFEEGSGDITYPTIGTIASKSGQARNKKYLEDNGNLILAHLYEDSVNLASRMAEYAANPPNSEAIKLKWDKIDNEVDIKYCKKEIALADKFLMDNAVNQPRGFEDRITILIDLINDAMLYKALAPYDVTASLTASNLAEVYLMFLDAYSAATIIASTPKSGYNGFGVQIGCDMEQLLAEKYELVNTQPPASNCSFRIVVPFVIAKATFDCEKMELEFGEGIVANIEHEFKSGNTTMAVGPGFGAELPFISMGVKNQVYVTFDRDGNYTDGGFKGEVSTEVGPEAGNPVEVKIGYTASFHSGATFSTEIMGQSTPIEF